MPQQKKQTNTAKTTAHKDAPQHRTKQVSGKAAKPIAIYYEHPHWFKPLFAELERRGTPHVRIDATEHNYHAGAATNGNGNVHTNGHALKPGPIGATAQEHASGNGESQKTNVVNGGAQYSLLFNRMSPSAWQ